MSANPLYKDANDADQAAAYEWSIFPSEPGVRSAIVQPVSDQRPATATPATDADVQQCRYCTEALPPGARECPLCLREVGDPAAERRTLISQPATGSVSRTPTVETTLISTAEMPGTAQAATASAAAGGAVYTLESPAQCPECDTEISAINIIRVLRTQVSFTSTLPRKAYVITCPACRKLLSAGLSGIL